MILQCRRRCDRGSALVETALVFTSFFAFLIGIVDFGQVLFRHQTLHERARAAVRWGIGKPLDEATRTAMENIVLFSTPRPASSARSSFELARANVLIEQLPGTVGSPAVLSLTIREYRVQMFAPFFAGDRKGREIRVTLPSELPD